MAAPRGITHTIGQRIEGCQIAMKTVREANAAAVSKARMRKSEAEEVEARMGSIHATLVWLSDNETEIRAWLESKKPTAAPAPT